MKLLDTLLRENVAKNAGYYCEFPNCRNMNCDPHHVGGRGHAVVYDPDTCIWLCNGSQGHHVYGPVSAHGTPEIFKKVMIESGVRSEKWFKAVAQKKQMIVKDTKEYRNYWKEKLREALNK